MLGIPGWDQANECAKLIYISGPHLFSYLFMEDSPSDLYRLFEFFYKNPNTTFSREAIIISEEHGTPQGLVIAHSVADLKKFSINEIKCVITMRGGFLKSFFHIIKMGMRLSIVRHYPKLNDDEYFIANLAVFEEHRGKGISSLLLKEVEKAAREKGHKKLSLYVELENDHAKMVYEKFGFQVEKEAVLPKKFEKTGLYGFTKMVKSV